MAKKKLNKIRQLISDAISENPKGEPKDIRGPYNWRKKSNALQFAKVWPELSLKTEGTHILVEDLKQACEQAGLLLEPNKGKNAYSGSDVTATSINKYLTRTKADEAKFTLKFIITEDARKNNVPEDLIVSLTNRLNQIKPVKDKDAPPKEPETIGANIDWVKDFIS